MTRRISYFIVFHFVCAGFLFGQCVSLSPGTVRQVRVTPTSFPCLRIRVAGPEPMQIYVEQPADIRLVVKMAGISETVDGFEFGIETATFAEVGDYQIEIRLVDGKAHSAVSTSVGLRNLSRLASDLWRRAEAKATESKLSPLPVLLADSLDAWNLVGDTSAIARTYLKIGDAAYAQPDAQTALTSYEQASAICKPANDLRCEAEAENNIGVVAQQLGDLNLAEVSLQAAAKDWSTISQFILAGITLSNLGLMYSRVGDYDSAIALLRRSSTVLGARNAAARGRALNTLGLCYISISEFEKAEINFRSALYIFRSEHFPLDAVRVLQNLGRTYLLKGQAAAAQKTLEQALRDAKQLADDRTIADVLNNLGQLSLNRGLLTAASQRFEAALAMDRKLADPRAEAYDLHYLGLVYERRGDITRARELLLEAFAIRKGAGLLDDASETMSELTVLEAKAGNDQVARDHADEALTLLESVRANVPVGTLRASYYSRKHRLFDEMVDLAAAEHGPQAIESALMASERGRARSLLDLLAEGSVLQGPPSQLNRRADIQHRIDLLATELSNAPIDRKPRIRASIEAALAESEQLEAVIRRPLQEKNIGRPVQSVQQIQAHLPPGAALIEFHLGEKRSLVWLVQKTSISMAQVPSRNLIEAHVLRTLALLSQLRERAESKALNRSFQQNLNWLSNQLFASFIPKELPQTLVIVPDGALHRLPFALLHPSLGSGPLGLSHDLIQVPAASVLLIAQPSRPLASFPKTILAVADPVFDASDPRVTAHTVPLPASITEPALPRLPFTADIAAISALQPPSRTVILRGFQASRHNFESYKLDDFAVLHFSTHALIDGQVPELSRIALSLVKKDGSPDQGFLRSDYFAGFHLRGSVVVLSACSTALGKQVEGEGLTGFSTSLLQAGASKVVLTLTDMDAESAAEFFKATYQSYLGHDGVSLEHALTLARNKMAHSARWHDPYYWAPIVLIGGLESK